MLHRLVALVIGAALLAPASARASGFIAIPPLRLDVGALSVVDHGPARHGMQIAVGIHWASMYPKDTPVDVGVGVVTAFVDDGAATVAKTAVDEDEALPSFVGGYLDLSSRVAGGRFWRTWAGARGEVLRGEVDGQVRVGIGGVARIAAELFVGGAGGGAGGSGGVLALGTFAIGVYADVSYRDLAGPLGGIGVSSGVSLRVPFILAGG